LNTGKQIRLNRIFATDGRAVIVAMDHGLPGVTPLANLADPGRLLEQLATGGADAILTTPGIACHFAGKLGKMGLILRLDGAATMLSQTVNEMRLIASVEDALIMGADAVAVMGFCGTPDETNSLEILGKVAGECRRLGVPLLAEMLPLGFAAQPTVTQLAQAARIGAETGADIIKLPYAGPPEAYRDVTTSCFAPVLVLGGSARAAHEATAQIEEAMTAGAAGVAVGRNVWQQEDAAEMTRTIVMLVHGKQA
jgi:DhnA family fructose-bisphosphate aldolase class Ia